MLTPDFLDNVSDDIVELYSELETRIITSVSKKLSKLDYKKDNVKFQIELLQESGKTYEQIVTDISKFNNISEKEVRSIFEDAMIKSLRFDDSIYIEVGLNPLPLKQSQELLQILIAGVIRTNGNIKNLTNTTAIMTQQLFIRSATNAHMDILSGAFTYDEALRNAVKTASREGTTVMYATGNRVSLESAVRRAVMTGVNQTAIQISENRMNEFNVDLVEVTAHPGARDTGAGYSNHASWQGKVYSRLGNSTKYKNFITETGYGTLEGLGGVNCRHSFYPFFEDESRQAYSKNLLKSYAKKDIYYNNEKLSQYEASQKQRQIERNIRKWKREALSLEAAGLDNSFENGKTKEWQKKARDFINETGLKRDYVRERIE